MRKSSGATSNHIGKEWNGDPYNHKYKRGYTESTARDGAEYESFEYSVNRSQFRIGTTSRRTINSKGTVWKWTLNHVGHTRSIGSNDYNFPEVKHDYEQVVGYRSFETIRTYYNNIYYTTTDRGSTWVSTSDKWTDNDATKKTIVSTKENYKSYSGNNTYSSTRRKLIITTTATTSSYVYLYQTFKFVIGGQHDTTVKMRGDEWKGNNNVKELIADEGKFLRCSGYNADGAWRDIFFDRRFKTIVIEPEKPQVVTAPRGHIQSNHKQSRYDGGSRAVYDFETRKPKPWKYNLPVFEGYCKGQDHRSHDVILKIRSANEENDRLRNRTYYEPPEIDVEGDLAGESTWIRYVGDPYRDIPLRNDIITYNSVGSNYTHSSPDLKGIINTNGEFKWSNGEDKRLYCATNSRNQTVTNFSEESFYRYGKELSTRTFWHNGSFKTVDLSGNMIMLKSPRTIATSSYLADKPYSPAGGSTGWARAWHQKTYAFYTSSGDPINRDNTYSRYRTETYTSSAANGDTWKGNRIASYSYRHKANGKDYSQEVYFKYKDNALSDELVRYSRINGSFTWTNWEKVPKGRNAFQTSIVGDEYAFGTGKNIWKFDTREPLIHGFGVGACINTWGFQNFAMAALYSTGTHVRFAYSSTFESLSWTTFATQVTGVHAADHEKTTTKFYTDTKTEMFTSTETLYTSRLISFTSNNTFSYLERTNDKDSDAPYATRTNTGEDFKNLDEISCAFLYMNSDLETCIKTNKYVVSSRDSTTFSTSKWHTFSNLPWHHGVTSLASRHYTTWKLAEENTFMPITQNLDETDYSWRRVGGGNFGFGVEGFSIIGGYDSAGNNRVNVIRHQYMSATMQSAVCREFTTKIDWVDFALNPEKTFAQGTGVLVRRKPHFSKTQTFDRTTWYSRAQNFGVTETQDQRAEIGPRVLFGRFYNQSVLTKNPPSSVYKKGAYKKGAGVAWDDGFIGLKEYYSEIDYEPFTT